MAGHHIDVVLAGPEGSWIARALEDAGFRCGRPDSLDDCMAALAIADWTIEGFEAFVADFDGPVIGVGWDPLEEDELERLGLDASYTRPVPIARLVRRVEALLGVETGDARPRRRHSTDRSASGPPAREPTLHLDGDEPTREPTMHLDDDASAIHRVDENVQPGSNPPTASGSYEPIDRHDSGAIEVHDLGTGSATLSPRLDTLLRDADRRLFPGEAPLDLRFPAGDESAHALVPDELLAEVSLPLDVEEGADPLEAFTFVGSPDLLDTNGGRMSDPGSSGGTGGLNHTPHTVVERGERGERGGTPGSASGSQSSVDLTREGLLPGGGVLRLLWQLRDASHPSTLTLEVAGGTSLNLTISGATLLQFEGPVNQRVVAELRTQGRLAMSARDEREATQILEDAVHRRVLAEFERDRAVRRARESLLGEACLASEARFAVSSNGTRRLPPHGWLARPFLHVAVEQVRRRIRVRESLRWLNIGAYDRLVLASSYHSRAKEAGLEPELIAALERDAGQPIARVFAGLPGEAGAVGAIFALACADAVRFETGDEDAARSVEALRESLVRAGDLAREGDYFRILGVAHDASAREIEEAFDRQVRRLQGLDLEGVHLDELEGLRQEIVQAAQDAYDILRDERLRQAYARAIAAR